MTPLLLLLLAAQEVSVVSAEAVGPAQAGETVAIAVKVGIVPGWHIYSTEPNRDVLPTSFSFEGGATISDTVQETAAKKSAEHGYKYHESAATFTLPVQLPATSAGKYLLKGTFNFQACNDNMCNLPAELPIEIALQVAPPKLPVPSGTPAAVPPEVTLASTKVEPKEARAGEIVKLQVQVVVLGGWHIYSTSKDYSIPTKFTLEGGAILSGAIVEPKPVADKEGHEIHEGAPVFTIPVKLPEKAPLGPFRISGSMNYQVCNANMCNLPADLAFSVDVKIVPGAAPAQAPDEDPDVSTYRSKGLLWLLGLAFGGGLASLLTPCVFPLLPITLTYFLKQGGSSRSSGLLLSSTYGAGIITSFTGIGVVLMLLLGATGAQQFAANGWTNLVITAIFFTFALSMFGLFEIKLPDSWTGALAGGGPKKGLFGAFILGLLFSVVTFTCTIPIAGSILAIAASGQHLGAGVAAMLVYSTAMALPFLVIGMFPSLIKEIPKSGGWLHTVKVTMGFLELGLASAYVWKADFYWTWGVFERPTMLALWIALSLATAFYLFGLFRLPGDNEAKEIGIARMMIALLFLFCSFFLVGGLAGNGIGFFRLVMPPEKNNATSMAPGGRKVSGWKSLKIHETIEEGEKLARAENKPLFIEFTGFA